VLGRAYRGRGAGAAVGVLDVGARSARQLLEEEGPLQPELLDLSLEAADADAAGVVGVLDLFGARFELYAFPAVGFLD